MTRAPGLAFATLALLARTAHAAPSDAASTVELPYTIEKGITDCFSKKEFDEAVRQRLSEDADAPRAPLVVSTHIAREGRQLRATVTLHGQKDASDASQSIQAGLGDCRTLSAAAALAVSLTIKRARMRALEAPPPAATSETAVPEPLPLPLPLPVSAPPPRRPLAVEPAPPPPLQRHRIQLRTHAVLATAFGVLPDVTFGTSVGASLRSGVWSAALDAGAWYPRTLESSTGRDGGKAQLVFVAGSACFHWRPLFVCGVTTGGEFRASGTGRLLVTRSSGSTYVALGGRLGTDVALGGPFALVIHGGLIAPLLRPTLRIGDELVWRAPILAGEIAIGLRMSIL